MGAEPVPTLERQSPPSVVPPLPPVPPAIRKLSRGRVKATVAKSAVLYLFPMPLVLAAIRALVVDETGRLALIIGALTCFWTAGAFARRGLTAEGLYLLGDAPDLPAVPWKLLSALLTILATALSAFAGGHTIPGAATFAVLAGVGHFWFFGRDLTAPRVKVTVVDGLDVTSVSNQLEQAEQRLRRIDAAAREIRVPEFRERLARITQVGRDIVAKIARDPRDATRARRFLHLYLDSTERVTEEYARTHAGARTVPLESNFRQLLIEMEHTFTGQLRRLLENDAVALDVEIEVLNARLKREGMGDSVEKRS